MIEAAGGLVLRWAMRERAEVLLVHRPGRDDWTFPKGKRRRSETAAECALREVREETGLWCELGDELPSTEYCDRKGRPKLVRYWAMSAYGGEFTPNGEVDEIRWARLDRVGELLTYERDLVVAGGLRALAALAG
jgi:8-oxo-dGTP diphosphatase